MIIKSIPASETRNLRQLTLRQHQPAETLVYPGDDAPDTIHLGAFENDELIGIASIYKELMKGNEEQESWRLRGMATSETGRGKGFGKDLMNKCLEHVRSNGGKLFWCNARISAEGFYEKFGMKRIGEIFHPEDLGPHVVMWMKVL